MMIPKVAVVALCAGLLMCAIPTAANELDWRAYFVVGSSADIVGGIPGGSLSSVYNSARTVYARTSTNTGVQDSFTSSDTMDGGTLPSSFPNDMAYVAWYRPATPSAAGSLVRWGRLMDGRRPLDRTDSGSNPSLSKTWGDLVVWAGGTYQADVIHLYVAASSLYLVPNSFNGHPVEYRLVMTHAPQAYWNDPLTQKEWLLPTIPSGGGLLADIVLPTAGAKSDTPISNWEDPLTATQTAGYRFNFVAGVPPALLQTPEPGGLAALATGLFAFAGIFRRRKA